MNRLLKYATSLIVFPMLVSCAPGPLAPGPPLPGIGPALEWIVFLLVGIGVAVGLRRAILPQFRDKGSAKRFQAYEILRERYAKGEITRDDYLRMTSDLGLHDQAHGD